MASAPARPASLSAVETRGGALPVGAGWEALVDEDRPRPVQGCRAATGRSSRRAFARAREAADMLVAGQSGDPVTVYRGDPAHGGRFHYTDAVDGFNFTGAREALGPVLDEISVQRRPAHLYRLDRHRPVLPAPRVGQRP